MVTNDFRVLLSPRWHSFCHNTCLHYGMRSCDRNWGDGYVGKAHKKKSGGVSGILALGGETGGSPEFLGKPV